MGPNVPQQARQPLYWERRIRSARFCLSRSAHSAVPVGPFLVNAPMWRLRIEERVFALFWRQATRYHQLGMIDKSFERSKNIPNLGGVIVGRSKHRFAVGAECRGSHGSGMTSQDGDSRARYCIP